MMIDDEMLKNLILNCPIDIEFSELEIIKERKEISLGDQCSKDNRQEVLLL